MTMLNPYVRFSISVIVVILLITIFALSTFSQTALKPVNSPEGGRILYGIVDGATTQAGGMAAVLRAVHNNCGERPLVGPVFKFRGTETVGVFFTVVNHPAGNVKVAGLLMAAMTGSQQVEAALVTDEASRFGTTVNPMLRELFAEWRPGGAAATTNVAMRSDVPAASTPASIEPSAAAAPPLRMVSSADGTAVVGVPDGWVFDTRSSSGTMILTGPHGELLALGMCRMGIDPTNPRSSIIPHLPGTIIYPYRGDLARSFTDIIQAWRRANGLGPAPIQVEELQPMQTPPGVQCVKAKGHMDPDGRGMQTFMDVMTAGNPGPNGGYTLTLTHTLLPNAVAAEERSTVRAIIDSWKVNQQTLNQQVAAATQRMNENTQALIQESQRQVERIHQIGAEATERMRNAEEVQAMRNDSFERQEDAISRNGQGFSNYLLDQTVVQDNNMYNNGTIGHGTFWNSTAEALVKADPNRYEIVDTPNYWRGVDY